MAEDQPGFRLFRSFTADDGEVLALSEWDDEAAARAWSHNAEHLLIQRRGRDEYYQNYTLYACDMPRVHRFDRDNAAPA